MLAEAKMLSAEQTEKLSWLQKYRTRYELAAIHADGRQVLVGYIGRKSKMGILNAMRNVGEKLVAWCDLDNAARVEFEKGAAIFSNGCAVRFTGRTQRDAIIAGELEFVGRS